MTRIEKLREKLKDGFSAAIIEHGPNRWYLSEFISSAGTLLITEDDALFIVDFRYIEAAEKSVKGAATALQEPKLDAQISAFIGAAGANSVLVEEETTLARMRRLTAAMPHVEFKTGKTLSSAITSLRAQKEQKEIDAIKAAQVITDAAFTHILEVIKPGMSERNIAAELEYFMRKNGADGAAFGTIAVSGPNSSLPHGVPGDREVVKGDFVTMDFGAKKDGYVSDMTRTVAVGEVSDEMRSAYDTVLEAHMAGREAARAGMTGKELDAVAREIIYAAGYEGKFGHGLGHSLGLEVHEDPRASFLFEHMLEQNVIMTIEPGVYLPGRFGVRIENMVVLKDGGNENLTHSPTDLIVL